MAFSQSQSGAHIGSQTEGFQIGILETRDVFLGETSSLDAAELAQLLMIVGGTIDGAGEKRHLLQLRRG